ncbi:hypothetical protein CCHR01_10150 [Colletotrichum chrysophilum]|uniref:Uncharacterized protein n=1 Tax=Colletotrichum chrysophilum TaxID=1836956 RepID=A0AAD9EG61_9PEZI|nr:hypothetical protein CCHR01_10150 [Colletotrichum chrysophilum]
MRASGSRLYPDRQRLLVFFPNEPRRTPPRIRFNPGQVLGHLGRLSPLSPPSPMPGSAATQSPRRVTAALRFTRVVAPLAALLVPSFRMPGNKRDLQTVLRWVMPVGMTIAAFIPSFSFLSRGLRYFWGLLCSPTGPPPLQVQFSSY